MQVIDGRKFTWKGNEGTSEASDLGFRDGWPASFYIFSPRTGRQALFLQGEADVDTRENELRSIQYFNPGGGITVTIFND